MFTRTTPPILITLRLLIGGSPFVQAQAGAGRTFEVASIR